MISNNQKSDTQEKPGNPGNPEKDPDDGKFWKAIFEFLAVVVMLVIVFLAGGGGGESAPSSPDLTPPGSPGGSGASSTASSTSSPDLSRPGSPAPIEVRPGFPPGARVGPVPQNPRNFAQRYAQAIRDLMGDGPPDSP